MRILAVTMMMGFVLCLAGSEQVLRPAPGGAMPLGELGGLHNLFSLGTNVFSGSTPEGEEGFTALAKLGVKTIVSVDGAEPDVELAKKHGMRYVHLPHGYDGISTNLQLQLAKASQSLPGPFYVHCHHGRHRGPAAAAVICMAREGWSRDQADAWLRQAGTSTNYPGLYKVVDTFTKPGEAVLAGVSAEFPERARVSGTVELMVEIDERWKNLKRVQQAGYRAPPDHPDIAPANEAVILWEHYREAQRLPETSKRGGDLAALFEKAEQEAKAAERLLREYGAESQPDIRARLDLAFQQMGRRCVLCHKEFRDSAELH